MPLDDIKTAIQNLDPTQWQELLTWVCSDEKDRRATLPVVQEAQAQIIIELQEDGKLDKPAAATPEDVEAGHTIPEWSDPGTDHTKMYREGDVVRHDGRIVRSTHKGLNHWEPGTLAFDGRIWEIIDTPDDEDDPQGERADSEPTQSNPATPAFKQPTGGHDAYKLGDRVTYNGEVYESTISGNVWSPTDYPAGWKKL